MADEQGNFRAQKSDYLEIIEVWESSVRATHHFLSAVGFYKHMGLEVISRSPLDSLAKPFPLLHMQHL